MISCPEAAQIILDRTPLLEETALTYETPISHFLKESILADRDLPPFHRVAVDGWAISYEAWNEGVRKFQMDPLPHPAGSPPRKLESPQQAIEVMTGSVLPEGTNAVVPVEKSKRNHQFIEFLEDPILMQNVHQKGSDFRKGDELIPCGLATTPPVWATAVSCGYTQVKVSRSPKISIISTGDELVAPHVTPKPYQIRRSNSFAIQSALLQNGFDQIKLSHCPDHEDKLRQSIQMALNESDYVVTTGGVSMGQFDFLPKIFLENEVERLFHKVKQKPGKPLWFGVGSKGQLVFGLPGNPVSALINCHRYLIPSLKHSIGKKKDDRPQAQLTQDIYFKKAFHYFQPVSITFDMSGFILATPVKTNGSGDFASLGKSDGFLELPSEKSEFLKGQNYPLYLWRDFQ